VKIRTRLSLAFLLLGGLSIYWLVNWVVEDLRSRYLAAMEEAMVDTATILATVVESQMSASGKVPADALREVLKEANRKSLNATIYEYTKTRVNVRVYITDKEGIVLYDSVDGRDEGMNYARWIDVARTLKGDYGARATHLIPDVPQSAILYVAAPLKFQGEIVGVLSVGKPSASVSTFLETARHDIIIAGLSVAAAVLFLGIAVSRWVSWPIERLTRYAEAVRDGKPAPLPPLGNDEIGRLGSTFEEMRAALEGKQYVEDYVQTLTHQLKSPVSAIRGAVELLEEEMPPAERKRFLGNLRSESGRLQVLIDRMLHLAALENRQELRDLEPCDLAELIREAAANDTRLVLQGLDTFSVRGERFLLEQAMGNLLQNAHDFAGGDGPIHVSLLRDGMHAVVEIHNVGPAIPEYALERIFERFYSLPRPDTGKKSTGLGLPFVRKVANLHGGDVSLRNQDDGVLARMWISTSL
jgi:two-component system sensor histidine kinase CreC